MGAYYLADIAHEAGLLKLNCDKALSKIGWEPSLNFQETVRYTADWYKAFYSKHEDFKAIYDDIEIAKSRSIEEQDLTKKIVNARKTISDLEAMIIELENDVVVY